MANRSWQCSICSAFNHTDAENNHVEPCRNCNAPHPQFQKLEEVWRLISKCVISLPLAKLVGRAKENSSFLDESSENAKKNLLHHIWMTASVVVPDNFSGKENHVEVEIVLYQGPTGFRLQSNEVAKALVELENGKVKRCWIV